MKKILTILLLFLATIGLTQNSGITYQAVIYGPNGQQLPGVNNQQYILANKTICLRFSIIDHTGTVEYQETIVTTTDKFGMVNLLIGTGTQVSGYAPNFTGIVWNANTKSLKVELDPSQNCQNFTQISNNPFTYVPFAYYSSNPGEPGPAGPAGPQGTPGINGLNGVDGVDGQDGLSAYQIWLNTGNAGTEAQFLASLQGAQGIQGPQGIAGTNGVDGAIGPQGPAGVNGIDGLSAYQVWLNLGNTGTEAQFIASLQGPQGPAGNGFTNGTIMNQMLYWNGSSWVTLNPGIDGQVLSICNGNLGWITINGICSSTTGTIGSINCSSPTNIGTLSQGTTASGVSSTISYTGGNGGTHSGQTVISTGVTGLTAAVAAGTFATGNGTLNYTISGTPSSSGTASFAINIGGQTCTLTINVANNLVSQYPVGSVFCASGPTAIVDVTNPVTGKTWMDRNLGASQVATSSTDALAYGDLYQWGRGNDGHQCRNSSSSKILSSIDIPNNAIFIISTEPPRDWRIPQNNNLWQGINGTNNPCPNGYRIPTIIELNEEEATWISGDPYSSPLKMTNAGRRTYLDTFYGDGAYYWSSTPKNTIYSEYLFNSNGVNAMNFYYRAYGMSIRCIKN